MAHCSVLVAEDPADHTAAEVDRIDDDTHMGREDVQALADMASGEGCGGDDRAAAADEGRGQDTASPRPQECRWQTEEREEVDASSRAYSLPKRRHLDCLVVLLGGS